ncbi:MAG: efflux RND transporter periplasmic adaptor subunit [Parahaliea sp.]
MKVIILLPVLLAGVFFVQGCSEVDSNATELIRPVLVTQPLSIAAGQDVFPGEIRARYEPELGFRIGGKISQRLVDVGDRVTEGTTLARLDSDDVRLQLDAARAQMASAEADHKLAGSELSRYRELLLKKVVSQSQFDALESRFDASAAQLRQARANLKVAGNQAEYAALKAPRDGVIAQRLAEAGQVVAAGQAVFVLAVDGDREVRIDLPEQNIGRFSIGMPVLVELWSKSGELFSGELRELSPAANTRSRTFEARVAFDNAKVGAELGQSARVFINDNASRALSVPMSALTAQDNAAFVWVVDPASSTLQKRPVEIGPYQSEVVPVLAGLQGDEWIVAAGTQLVREGQRVIAVDRNNRRVELAVATGLSPASADSSGNSQ